MFLGQKKNSSREFNETRQSTRAQEPSKFLNDLKIIFLKPFIFRKRTSKLLDPCERDGPNLHRNGIEGAFKRQKN